MGNSQFLKKIPNKDKAREFFVNSAKLYCPPKRDLSRVFTYDVLSGKKKLFKLADVKWVEFVPLWPEFSSKSLWEKA